MTARVLLEIETGTLPRKGGPTIRTYSVAARIAPADGADPHDTTRAEGRGHARCIRRATAQALRDLARIVETNDRH